MGCFNDRSKLSNSAVTEADVGNGDDHRLFVDCINHCFDVDGEIVVGRNVYYFGAATLLCVPDLTNSRKFVIGGDDLIAALVEVECRCN